MPPLSDPDVLQQDLRVLLRYLQQSECGTIRFSLFLFPGPDCFGADVQHSREDGLGKANLPANPPDALRGMLRRWGYRQDEAADSEAFPSPIGILAPKRRRSLGTDGQTNADSGCRSEGFVRNRGGSRVGWDRPIPTA